MKTFNYTFSAGETKTFPSGRFFIAITAGDAINVDFFKHLSKLDESAQGVTSGYYVELEEGFDSIQIYSATAQTVKIAISHGRGGFNITSQIITDIQGGQLTPQTLSGTSHFKQDISSTLVTAVTPAANVNGVRIDSVVVQETASCGVSIMYKTSAPSAWNDTSAGVIAASLGSGAAIRGSNAVNGIFPIIIPAGYGIYIQSSSSSAATLCALNYEIL